MILEVSRAADNYISVLKMSTRCVFMSKKMFPEVCHDMEAFSLSEFRIVIHLTMSCNLKYMFHF